MTAEAFHERLAFQSTKDVVEPPNLEYLRSLSVEDASKREWPVIIEGGGPAGATTAMGFSEAGYDVLVVDKKKFPGDKTCGDAYPARVWEILRKKGMGAVIDHAGFYPIEHLFIQSPKGHEMYEDIQEESEDRSRVIPREVADAYIFQHAIALGAEYLNGTVVGLIRDTNDRVRGVKVKQDGQIKEIESRLVVGAGGATSRVAKELGIERNDPVHRAVANRVYLTNDQIKVAPNTVEFYLSENVRPGYAWIFPNEFGVNAGLGMRGDKYMEKNPDLRESLRGFFNDPAINRRLSDSLRIALDDPDFDFKGIQYAAWQLPFGAHRFKRRKLVHDGAIVCGDAAGLINPLTGGGIGNAVTAADIASEVGVRALRENPEGVLTSRELADYEKRVWEELGPSMTRSYVLARVVGWFPGTADYLIRRGGQDTEFAKQFISKL